MHIVLLLYTFIVVIAALYIADRWLSGYKLRTKHIFSFNGFILLAVIATIAYESYLLLSMVKHQCKLYFGISADKFVTIAMIIAGIAIVLIFAFNYLYRQYIKSRGLDNLTPLLKEMQINGKACYVFPSDKKKAFSAGLFVPKIYFSSALWDELNEAQRLFVYEHEMRHHYHMDRLYILFLDTSERLLRYMPYFNSHVVRAKAGLEYMANGEYAIGQRSGIPALGVILFLVLILTTPEILTYFLYGCMR